MSTEDPPNSGNPSGSHAATVAPHHGGQSVYIGTSLAGRYKILRKLGEGGMGVVYLAEHVFIEKKVAVKILSDDFARKADLVTRFMQEAKAASKIGHENIIDITDFGETPSGSVFFVMEFLDGSDLAHHIREGGRLELPRAALIMNQICRALGAAHNKGIIHRDLKPENVYLVEREGRSDFVKILDFGIAKMSSLDNEGGARLTRTGMIFGTPEYMSPEQAKGDRPDHRVDIYAAGCILYEMLTGNVPFYAETFMGVLTKHMFEPPEPPTVRCPEANISPAVEAVIMKALHKDREQRFQTMKDMAVALAEAVGYESATAWGNEGSSVNIPLPVPRTDTSQVLKTPISQPTTVAPLAPPKSRSGAIIALVAGLALGGAGFAFWKLKMQDHVVVPPPKPVVVETPKVEVKPDLPVVEKPAAPVQNKIAFDTRPPGAEVYNGPERLGETPFFVEYPANTSAFDVVLRKKGFKDSKIHVMPDRARDYKIDLTKMSGGGRPDRPVTKSDPVAQPKLMLDPKPTGKLRDLKDPFAN